MFSVGHPSQSLSILYSAFPLPISHCYLSFRPPPSMNILIWFLFEERREGVHALNVDHTHFPLSGTAIQSIPSSLLLIFTNSRIQTKASLPLLPLKLLPVHFLVSWSLIFHSHDYFIVDDSSTSASASSYVHCVPSSSSSSSSDVSTDFTGLLKVSFLILRPLFLLSC